MRGNRDKLNSTLYVCSININCSTNAMHELAHNITMTRQKFDIVLVQEPWWNRNITTSFQGWQVILPTTIKENDCPRVVTYYKLQAGVEITLRTDISLDLDFMILDVKCIGS